MHGFLRIMIRWIWKGDELPKYYLRCSRAVTKNVYYPHSRREIIELRRLVVPAGNILLVGYHTFTAKNGLPFCKGGVFGIEETP